MIKGGFDVLFDNIVAALEKYSLEQPVLERFTVSEDSYRSISAHNEGFFLCFYMGSINPTDEAGNYKQYDVTYFLEPVVVCKRDKEKNSDQVAGIRLRALIQQALNCLFLPENIRFGMDKGTISTLKMPSIEPLPPDKEPGEMSTAAARMTLNFTMSWEPAGLEGTPLERITVNADDWSVIIPN